MVSDFEERFCGTWGSFLDYAETLAEEIGLIPQDAPEELVRYFNWVAWTRYSQTTTRWSEPTLFPRSFGTCEERS